MNVSASVDMTVITAKVDRLWDLDSIGIREVDPVPESTLDNISITGKLYSVCLPWRVGHDPLPSNYNVHMTRLSSQFKNFKQNPDV